mmetsp:Transcript_24233/g.40461  ORF Transcript_24233/g.40461 Transcript_24233/m.40461 type:complete len:97 (+) Transcript_24233:207-497(+)
MKKKKQMHVGRGQQQCQFKQTSHHPRTKTTGGIPGPESTRNEPSTTVPKTMAVMPLLSLQKYILQDTLLQLQMAEDTCREELHEYMNKLLPRMRNT